MAMTDREHDLLTGIEGVVLDQPGASLPFSVRLARDNAWSQAYAERVVADYRRFVFLAATAGHPVTPSEEVDQAWHLHLVYTRSYWDELCGEVLGFPLHHGPTVGGPAEGAKFTDWYQRTLESYRRLFGTEPPADIWPPPGERFANADRFRRINTAEQWVVPKPALARPGGARSLRLPLVGATALVLTGCAAAAGSNPAIAGASLLATSVGTVLLAILVFGGIGLTLLMLAWMAYHVVTGIGSRRQRGSGRGRDSALGAGPMYLGSSDDDGDDKGGGGGWGWFGGGDSDSGGGDAGCGGGGCGGGGCGA